MRVRTASFQALSGVGPVVVHLCRCPWVAVTIPGQPFLCLLVIANLRMQSLNPESASPSDSSRSPDIPWTVGMRGGTQRIEGWKQQIVADVLGWFHIVGRGCRLSSEEPAHAGRAPEHCPRLAEWIVAFTRTAGAPILLFFARSLVQSRDSDTSIRVAGQDDDPSKHNHHRGCRFVVTGAVAVTTGRPLLIWKGRCLWSVNRPAPV